MSSMERACGSTPPHPRSQRTPSAVLRVVRVAQEVRAHPSIGFVLGEDPRLCHQRGQVVRTPHGQPLHALLCAGFKGLPPSSTEGATLPRMQMHADGVVTLWG